MLAERVSGGVTYLPLIDTIVEMAFHCLYRLVWDHVTGIDRYQSGYLGAACGDIINLMNSIGGNRQMRFQLTFFDCHEEHPVPSTIYINDHCHQNDLGVMCMSTYHNKMSAVSFKNIILWDANNSGTVFFIF